MPPQPPTSIGRYQIVRALGEGGMGSVYLAKDPEIDRFVAIKLLRSGLDDSLRERFRREARAIGQLHHINIVMVFDVGEHHGSPFFAMEYIEGHTLQQIVRSGDPITLSNTLHWIEGLCSGLHYAHKRGIVHRDIKPANLVIDDENRLKILDFGIARGMAPGMTQAGMLIGTPNYMSPEQVAGKPIDHRSDTFAVGAVFYEVLAGKQAFPGDIRTGILQKILNSQHVPVGQLVPALPEAIAAIVERCLGKEPEERYPDLETMRKEVAAAAIRVNRETDNATVIARAVDLSAGGRMVRTPDDAARAELLRQRRERIDQHIARARAALASRDLVVATDACTQALILDPELAEAFELQERIQRLQHARRLVEEAQTELGRGAVTMASSLIDRASGVDPDMPEVAKLREQVGVERRRREERARQLQEVVVRGRTALEKDRLDVARAAVDEVIAAEPNHEEAKALAQSIEERLAAKRRAEEEAARARDLVARARQRFAAGEHDAAIDMLRAHSPAHASVDTARSALELKRREILRRQEEERRIEAERKAERERREAQKRADDERRRVEEERRQEERRRAEEDRRRADEQRRLEAERRAEEKRKKEEEARARAEEERRLEEQRRRAAEEQRIEAERRAQEERAREEEARRAEEEARQREAEAAQAAQEPPAASEEEKTLVLTAADVAELRGDVEPSSGTAPPGEVVEPPVPTAPEPAIATPIEMPPSDQPSLAVAAGVAAGASTAAEAAAARRRPEAPAPRRADVQKGSRAPLSPAMLGGIAAGVLLLVAVVVWFATRGNGPVGGVAPTPVAVLFDVRPWAAVESIVTKSDSRPVEAPCPATPCVVNLPPGEYRVRARNPFFQNPLEFDLSVAAGPFQEVRHNLPDLDPEEEIRRLFGGASR